jgi:predicted phosphodiesterase
MENRFKYIAISILIGVVFIACDKFEFRGFFISYESANERFHQSMSWNSEHPYKKIIVPVDNYTLFVMGDSHVGGTNNLDIFVNEAQRANAAAIVLIGDLTTGHADDFIRLQQHLPDQDIMYSFPILGNHDLYFDGWTQFRALFGTSTYLFSVNTPQATDLYLCLDSGSGTFGSDQLDWLNYFLESERSDYRRCVLFTHNNFFRFEFSPTANPLIEELYVLLELTLVHDIDMVVTGHDHDQSMDVLGNTTYITTGALKDNFSDAGYLKLIIDQGEIAYEFVNL